mgnify:CR=1 FL=1
MRWTTSSPPGRARGWAGTPWATSAVVLAQMLCTMIFARSALKVEMYLGRDLKKRLFTHLQTLSFSYYNTTPVGTIMARVMSDANRIGSVFAWSLVDIFWSAAYVIGCMGVMLFLNWRLALLVIVVVPAIALSVRYRSIMNKHCVCSFPDTLLISKIHLQGCNQFSLMFIII